MTTAKPAYFRAEPRPLTSEDMSRLFDGPAFRPVISADRLKNAHHRIARLAAAGLRNFEIKARTGYSDSRISILLGSPAMKDLIAHYRTLVDAKFVESTDEYATLTRDNMLMAEQLINDRLAESEEAGEPLPLKDLVAISRDAADRLGYGKKSQVTKVNLDFATQLERAIARSGKTLEVAATLERSEN